MNINALAVETAHLAAKAVTADKIADGTVTRAKISSATHEFDTPLAQPHQIYFPLELGTNFEALIASRNAAGAFKADKTILTGRLYLTPVYLKRDTTINTVKVKSGSTGATNPTNQWAAIYDSALALLRQSADNLTAAWGAATVKEFDFSSSPVLVENDDKLMYVGIMVKATVCPTLEGFTLTAVSANNGESTTGLTDTAPDPAAAITPSASVPIVVVL